jgi:hypothetical protein
VRISKQGGPDVRISEARFFLIAAGLHVALPVMAFVAPKLAPIEAPAPIEVAIEVEVEPTRPAPETAAAAVAPHEETPRTDATPARVERPITAGNVEPGPVATEAPNVEAPSTAAPSVPAAPTGKSEYDGPPPAVLTGPAGGLPGIGAQAWSIPGVVPDMGKPAAAPTTSPKATVDPQIATKVLNDAMKEKDKGLGLDLPGAGSIASDVRTAVQGSALPSESSGTFEVRLSPSGKVLGVRVTSSNGGSADAWAATAKIVAAMSSARAIMMKSTFEKGAVVYINMKSTNTLPDGTKSVIERQGAGATFDLANIGAHMQRVVRTSISVVAVK